MTILVVAGVAGVLFDSWWVREVSRLFNSNWTYDFGAGFVVGLTPLVILALGAQREQQALIRAGMALLAWAVGTEPYRGWAFANKVLAHLYAHQVPGYLPGFGIGLLVGVVGFALLDYLGRL